MPISIDITTNGAEVTIPAGLERLLSQENLREFNRAGGRAASNAAKEYHLNFNQAGKWRGESYLGKGVDQPGRWGDNVANAWIHDENQASEAGTTIFNDAPFYRHKVKGGTITPKGGYPFLTIPVVREAKGRRAKDYKGNLFEILTKKGTRGLFEKDGDGVRMVYLLKSQVTQSEWPGALPESEPLARGFVESWVDALEAYSEAEL